MNIARAFADYMEDQALGTFATDIFIGGAPQKSPNNCWWIIAQGGGATTKLSTGELIKEYSIEVYYRNVSRAAVYETLQSFEELLNSGDCNELASYVTVEVMANVFPVDIDLDNQQRSIGLMQVVVATYL